MDAWRNRERRHDARFALVCAVLANIHRGPDDDPLEVGDFMPMSKAEREQREEEKVRRDHERLAKHLSGLSAGGGDHGE